MTSVLKYLSIYEWFFLFFPPIPWVYMNLHVFYVRTGVEGINLPTLSVETRSGVEPAWWKKDKVPDFLT